MKRIIFALLLSLIFFSHIFAFSDNKKNATECWIGLDVTFPDTLYVGEKAKIVAKAHFKLTETPALDSLIVEPIPSFSEGWNNKVVRRGGEFFLSDTLILFPQKKDVGDYRLLFRASTSKNPSDTRLREIHFIIVFSPRVPQIIPEPKFTPDLSNTIYWIPAKNALHQYAVCFNPSSPGTEMRVNRLFKLAMTDTMSTTFENLQNGTRYGYFVRAIFDDNGKQLIVNSDTTYSTQDNTPPFDVTTTMAKPNPDGVVVISWESVADAISYVRSYSILRRKMNGEFRLIDTLAVGNPADKMIYSYHDSLGGSTGLIEGEHYSYKILATDAVGNRSEGSETAFVMPDKTPPPDPRFVWEKGNGYDYFDPFTHKYFAGGCSEKISLVNPYQGSNQNSITQADSVRFQASIDKIDFLGKEEELPGFAFSTSWLPIDSLSHTFNYCILKDLYQFNVNGHPTFYRARFKDKSGNMSQWSYVDRKNQTVSVVMDNAAPGDVHNLTAVAEVNSSFTDGTITVKWGEATEAGSGLAEYIVYRKIGHAAFDSVGSVKVSLSKPTYSYEEAFSEIDTSTTITYRIGSRDHVGNLRDAILTQQEASVRCLLGPGIHLDSTVVVDDTLMTNHNYGIVSWKGFDETGVTKIEVYVEHMNQLSHYVQRNVGLDTVHIKLPEDGEYAIRAQAIFGNPDVKSTWSNTVKLYRKTITPPRVDDLAVISVDTCSAEGNLYLRWSKPIQNDWVYGYQIWRKESGKPHWDSLGCVWSGNEKMDYMDPADSTLKTFSFYLYKLKTLDPLGNLSDDSNIDSSYCNRPPKIKGDSTDTNTGIIWVHWEESQPSDVRKYKFMIKIDSLGNNEKWEFLKTEVVIDTTSYSNPGFSRGSIYRFRVKEIPYIQNRWRDNLSTTWSYPLIVPFGKVPPNVDLDVQALPSFPDSPDQGKIFLHWTWQVGVSNMAPDSFQIYRGKTREDLVKIATVAASTDTFTDSLLSVRTDYYYKVVSLDKYGTHSRNDTIRRARIDPIWMFTPFVKDTNFVYFRDSLSVRWGWKDSVNHETDKSFGAAACQLQLSANRDFSIPDTLLGWVDSGLKKSRLKKPPWVSNSTPFVFVRIRAKDKYGHFSPWSTTYFTLKKRNYDAIPPPIIRAITIDSVYASTLVADSNKVIAALSWNKVTDKGCGTAFYEIYRDNELIHTDRQPFKFSYNDKVYVDKLLSYKWSVKPVDSLLNRQNNVILVSIKFMVDCPESVKVEEATVSDSIITSIRIAWKPIKPKINPDSVNYILEIADSLYKFNNRFLIAVYETNDSFYVANDYEYDNGQFFYRLKARAMLNSKIYESSWSTIKEYSTSKDFSYPLLTNINENKGIPERFNLQQNYPNPFNMTTSFIIDIPVKSSIVLNIYNVRGQLIRRFKRNAPVGSCLISWDGKDSFGYALPSGVYIYTLYAIKNKKMLYFEKKKLVLIK